MEPSAAGHGVLLWCMFHKSFKPVYRLLEEALCLVDIDPEPQRHKEHKELFFFSFVPLWLDISALEAKKLQSMC
jgi:hypothetical protein